MGFIDADAHVRENDSTWDYFDPNERHYRPITVRSVDASSKSGQIKVDEDHAALGGVPYWIIQDQRVVRHDRYNSYDDAAFKTNFPEGSLDLSGLASRLARMDELGIDVQVIFSTFWIEVVLDDPLAEAALARSYNRWMADATAGSGGRLRWVLKAPLRIDRALEELEFGKQHGAVAVHMQGVTHELGLSDPNLWPLYERAQDLDLVIAVHTGTDSRVLQRQPQVSSLGRSCLPVASAFFATLVSDLPARFPRLRWAFLEAGSAWVPWAVQEYSRCGDDWDRRFRGEWQQIHDIAGERNMYVSCQIDDDLPYILPFVGARNMVIGTDYSHLDMGSDPEAHRLLLKRGDVPPATLHDICDTNGHTLYALD